MTLDPRIEAKIQREPGGCWLWVGALKYPSGYGKIARGPRGAVKYLSAHRVVYVALRGQIPAGLTLDHLCRVRRCVNPDHLEPVTLAVNIMRGEGACATHARKTACPKCGGAYIARNDNPRWRNCVPCRRLGRAAYHVANRTKHLQQMRDYYRNVLKGRRDARTA